MNTIKFKNSEQKSNKRGLLKYLLILISLFAGTNAYSQLVSNYSFNQSTATYKQAGVGAQLTAATGTYDDNNFALVTLPFSFIYCGVSYTTIGISANGYVKLGGTTSTYYSNVFASQALTLAPFAQDLYGVAAGRDMSYATIGSTGSRAFVVQWTNWGFYSAGTNAISFQLKLFEGTNNIQFVYGASAPTGTTVYVGLSGATTTDLNVRTTSTSWAATTAGGSGNTCTFSSTVFPANGAIFQ